MFGCSVNMSSNTELFQGLKVLNHNMSEYSKHFLPCRLDVNFFKVFRERLVFVYWKNLLVVDHFLQIIHCHRTVTRCRNRCRLFVLFVIHPQVFKLWTSCHLFIKLVNKFIAIISNTPIQQVYLVIKINLAVSCSRYNVLRSQLASHLCHYQQDIYMLQLNCHVQYQANNYSVYVVSISSYLSDTFSLASMLVV